MRWPHFLAHAVECLYNVLCSDMSDLSYEHVTSSDSVKRLGEADTVICDMQFF